MSRVRGAPGGDVADVDVQLVDGPLMWVFRNDAQRTLVVLLKREGWAGPWSMGSTGGDRGVATGRPACQRAARVLRFAPALSGHGRSTSTRGFAHHEEGSAGARPHLRLP